MCDITGRKSMDEKTWGTPKLRLYEWNAIALSGPVHIAFSFASHARESHNNLVLMTQHSSFPSRASGLAWPSH
ncbi:MAG: hypothetical protein PV344_02895 [Anaplasma sp.]|nr:hypothetical protein [Anaplasma sp.]